MRQIRIVLSLLVVFPSLILAQDAATIQRAVSGLEWREIGPATMGGRISDLAVLETNPAVFYVGTATGGVWKTTNHGTTWTPLFDDQATASVGDVTLAPSNPNVVWVGTGEHQNRQSSPWGAGVYRSTDAGRTWTHLGLTNTRHISRIVVHLRDPDVAWVGAVGHLWGPNEERGVYKTTDGGQTWERVLYVDENTGVIDLVGDPGDPETLYAAMYQRRRTAFGFNGGGPGSGIYRTTDGGATWTELTNGLPEGDMGRIGLEVYRRDGNLVYAVVEARGDAQGVYRSTDRGETWEQMSQENPRPMYFSKIRIDPNDPERIYLGGVQLHVSSDGGRTFVRNAREVHSDHHALWIDPGNSNHLIMGSDGGMSVSFDRAESWRMYDNIALGQFYEIGFDMQDPYFVCGGLQDNGTWCGPSATWSQQGIRNHDWFNIHGGDGFYAQVDPSDPSIVFAESQNGNISRVDLTTGERQSIRPLMRGDGDETEAEEDDDYRWNWNTPIHISVHNRQTIYAGANVLARSTDQGRSWTIISPDLTKDLDRSTLEIMGVPENRMLSRHDGVSSYGNITTIAESPLNANVLYVGTDDGNVQVTRDGGATWTNVVDAIPELPERTYVSRVVASNHEAGAVYATFDGHYADDYRPYVYVSTNYGESWRRITNGLPDWSVNVLAEHPRTGSLLFAGNEVGVFFSIDRGEEWHRLDSNLPTVPVDDIKIHPRENDLILGTHGRSIWIMDDVAPLEQLSAQVLAADVHAFPVGQATLVNRNSPQGWTPGAFETPDGPTEALIRYYLGRDVVPAAPVTADEPAEQGPMAANGQDEMNGDTAVSITIMDATGATVRTLDGPGDAGTHQVEWDLRMNPPYEVEEDQQGGGFFGRPRGPLVMPGTYTARIDAHGTSRTVEIPVRGDPRIQISSADRQARQDALMTLNALGKPLHDAGEALDRVIAQVESAKKLVEDAENAPDALKAEADSLSQALDDVDDDVNGASRTALRLFFTMERATMRPSVDQLWQVDEVWEDATEAIGELNVLITERIPAFHQRLNAEGIRPDAGQAVALPARR